MTGSVTLTEEGAVLPDTYAYEYGTPRASLLARAEAAEAKALAAAWAERAPDLPLASPRDAAILASIVERETAKPEERAHIAAVFLNRLRLGMRLQADSTVVYAASGGLGVLDHPLTRAELELDSPYNTYRNHWPAAGADLRAGDRQPAARCCIRRRARTFISSPTAAAGTCSPAPWRSTRRT